MSPEVLLFCSLSGHSDVCYAFLCHNHKIFVFIVTKLKVKKLEIQQPYPLRFLTSLSMSCNCILSHVLHCVPWRPSGTSGTGGRCISSNVLSHSVSPVTHLTTVRSSSSLVVPCDISGSSNFFVIAWNQHICKLTVTSIKLLMLMKSPFDFFFLFSFFSMKECSMDGELEMNWPSKELVYLH